MKKILLPVMAVFAVGCSTTDKNDAIPIIDTHIHLYDTTRPQGLPWPPKSDKVLYRPVLTEHFDKHKREQDQDHGPFH